MDLANTMQMDDVDSDDNHNLNIDDNNTDVRGYLVRIDTSGNHQTPFILTKATTTIGRKKTNDIVLTNPTISTNHAEVIIDTSRHMAYIVDLRSTNKTRIGQQLPTKHHQNTKTVPNRECIVHSCDYVTFGDVQFIFYHEDDYDEYQQQMLANHCNSNPLIGATQSLDDEEPLSPPQQQPQPQPQQQGISITAANTASNRSNKDEVDLKLSLSDDESQMKNASPKRVKFAEERNEEGISENMEPTLMWDEEDSTCGETGDIELEATMAFDDEDDALDGIQLEATIAFDDEEETQDIEDKAEALPVTMAFEDEDEDEDKADVLAAAIAFDDVDEFESDGDPNRNEILPDTMPIEDVELAAIDDGDDDDDDDDDKGALEATMAFDDDDYEDVGALPATVAMDDDDDVLPLPLPATVAMDDVDDDELAATMAIDDVDDVGNDTLAPTIAMDDNDDVLEATMVMDDVVDDDDDILPATVAIDDVDDTVDAYALPATIAMDDDGDNAEETVLVATVAMDDDSDDGNDDKQELEATMAIEDTEEEVEDNGAPLAATMAMEDEDEEDTLHSVRPVLDATLQVMTEDEETEDEALLDTVPIEIDDVDLNSTIESNTNETNHALPDTVVDEAEQQQEATQNAMKRNINEQKQRQQDEEEEEPQEAVISVQRGGRRRERKKIKTHEQDEEKAIVETTTSTETLKPTTTCRRSARIARRNSINKAEEDEDGDITMTNKNKPKKKKETSLTALFASRGTNKRGRKRNIAEREKEEEDEHNGDIYDEEVKPPPTKRPRRGRVAKRSKIVTEEEDDDNDNDVNTNNGLRRSKRDMHIKNKKRKPSPNRRRSTRRQTKLEDLSSDDNEDTKVVLLRTGTDNASQKKKLEDLGAIVLNEYDDTVTHIVSTQPRRTLKFVSGMATAKHIVTDAWPTQCIKRKTLHVDERKYFPNNKATREFEKKYGFKLKESFKKCKERKEALFDGYKVYFTKEHKANVKQAIGTMAQSHGAALMSRIPKATASDDDEIIVIGSDVKHKHCKNIAKKGFDIYNRNIIITSILRQQINFDDNEFELK